ncbi:hypothetical protein DY000_02018238 [Brassica cretica]|uniref:No apical meristem-associated C-terminal domain-containing protein n=1 Tax=Brassica cretica TaxID=69181 RepID=A0ABQ7CY30_BRACR|nr:hypothetical protein DY000_02018238 [Brassica cretica]
MDSNPYVNIDFVDLLQSQQDTSSIPFLTTQATEGNRPPSVKSAKARGKKTMGEGKELSQFQTMWSIKKQDLVMKERLSKMKLLDSEIEECSSHAKAIIRSRDTLLYQCVTGTLVYLFVTGQCRVINVVVRVEIWLCLAVNRTDG